MHFLHRTMIGCEKLLCRLIWRQRRSFYLLRQDVDQCADFGVVQIVREQALTKVIYKPGDVLLLTRACEVVRGADFLTILFHDRPRLGNALLFNG